MSHDPETPLEAARRYVMEQETKIVQQQLLLRRLASAGRLTAKANQDLAVMEDSLDLLQRRALRLKELGPGPSASAGRPLTALREGNEGRLIVRGTPVRLMGRDLLSIVCRSHTPDLLCIAGPTPVARCSHA